MAALSTCTEMTPKLQKFVAALNAETSLPLLLLDPCSSSRETYRALAVFANGKTLWYEDTCLSLLRQSDDVDLVGEIKKFARSHSILEDVYKGVFANQKILPGNLTVQASVGHNASVVTDEVHFLSQGGVVCFSAKLWIPPAQAVLLQRTTFRGAKTFDMELLNGDTQSCSEIRLVPKIHLEHVEVWGTQANMYVFRSPGNPVPTKLLLSAYRDGENWDTIAKALTGEESSCESDSEEEWIPVDVIDSDETSSDEESDNEDLLMCLN